MKKPGKWIDGIGPETPVDRAARRVLGVRMEAIETYLPLAGLRADEDIEHVHQLRVTTRRAEAALRTFEPYLRPKRYRRARKALRRIRRAAGVARASDVHLLELGQLREGATGNERDALSSVIRWTRKRRKVAQKDIVQVHDRYAGGRLARLSARVLERIGGDGVERPMRELARRSLAETLVSFDKAIANDLGVLENLHALRIRAKRLRYSLEIFAPCLGPDFKTAYSAVGRLQEALGNINDHDEMTAWLGSFLEAHRIEPGHNGGTSIDDATHGAIADLVTTFERRRDDGIARFHAAFDDHVREGILDGVRALIESEHAPERAVGP